MNNQKRNSLLLMNFYELSLSNAFFEKENRDTIAWFDLYFRPHSDVSGLCIMAGLEQAVSYIKSLHFSENDLDFLQEQGLSADFLDYLGNFKFSCDLWAVPDGTPVFPGEPVVKVRGPIVQAQLLESILSLSINHQTQIATKANRIVRAAQGRGVIEFGTRKAHGIDSAIFGARAAYIGGCKATSSAAAAKEYNIEAFHAMNHSWMLSFDSELEAFCAYARQYPDNCTLLIDTYDTLGSGLENAIKTFKQEILPRGFRPKAVRIDSGDLAYLSKRIRSTLNEEGFPDCDIIASNRLDEYIIKEMLSHGARIDSFLVGEKLITANRSSVGSCEYKLAAVEQDNKLQPKIKISQNVSKMTPPSAKLLWRLFDRETGKAIADLLTLEDEIVREDEPYELFDPNYTWKRKTVTGFVARQLLQPIFKQGELVYDFPSLHEVRAYCMEQVDSMWEEVLRFEYPHDYYVDFSQRLWDLRQSMISEQNLK